MPGTSALLDRVIRGGILVQPGKDPVPGNVGIQDGKIAAITGPGVELPARETFDATGKHLFPGIIEPHAHWGLGAGLADAVTESRTYVYATQIAEVEVVIETGWVDVLRVVAAHDCGRVINPMLVEGQIEGAVAMGIDYALTEEIVFRDGVQINPNFTDYVMPTILDVPPMEVIMVEKYDPTGPFGAKGVGEPTLVPTAAAILNAIYDAVGVRLYSLPATPEKVLRALQEQAA